MPSRLLSVLCHYYYDPLDRLVAQDDTSRFYQQDRLVTEIRSAQRYSFMHYEEHLIAQQDNSGCVDTRLFVTDQQRSVIDDATRLDPAAYTSFGYRSSNSRRAIPLGFNGERLETFTGCYLLGNGYRSYNPVLMRFTSPDRESPFGAGGLNVYAYCSGDPINRTDPSGRAFNPIWMFRNLVNRISKRIDRLVDRRSRAGQPSTRARQPSTATAGDNLDPFSSDSPGGTSRSYSSPAASMGQLSAEQASASDIRHLRWRHDREFDQLLRDRPHISPVVYGQRMDEWRAQGTRIRARSNPPPSYDSLTTHTTGHVNLDGLPDYNWAIRQGPSADERPT